MIRQSVNDLTVCEDREPVVLVLDYAVQMLPWENIPILRKEELYHMPSVGSVFVTLDRCYKHQGQVRSTVAHFPLIDPLNVYYVLNPHSDQYFSKSRTDFEDYFRKLNLEGKVGSAPTAEELCSAFKSCDLFLHIGHGSGARYIDPEVIRKQYNCCAALLMGCSSGALELKGSYMPQGPPF